MKRRTRSTPLRYRLGFTLIELLVVIVILGILVGLLVPAVMRAVGTAKEAAVAAEIRALAQALTDFKARYGEYPPSRIIISENGDYSSATLTGVNASFALLGPRSTQYLRRFWPRMDIRTDGSVPTIPGGGYDADGSQSVAPKPYLLTGPECLVFFLGGVPFPPPVGSSTGQGWSVGGFAKNPANPFQSPVTVTNRNPPFFEFDNNRLRTNGSNPFPGPFGFPGYTDSLGAVSVGEQQPFYCYFSAYGGSGYDPGDADFTESDPPGNVSPIRGAFLTSNAPTSGVYNGKFIWSPSPNPYTNSVPVPTAASGDVNTGAARATVWQNPQTFQIISPGRDRSYGIGGQYVANGNERLPFISDVTGYVANSFQTQLANGTVTTQTTLSNDVRSLEKDNVTNFSQGKLD